MKRLIRLLIITLFFSATFTGCYYDKEDILYKSKPPCDTSNVTYSQTMVSIVTANCNVCHSTQVASGGVITDTYAGLSKVALNDKLWPAVNWTGPIHMPQGADKLSDCDLAKIKIWIDAEAPEN
jgi:hypothetical protein